MGSLGAQDTEHWAGDQNWGCAAGTIEAVGKAYLVVHTIGDKKHKSNR